MGITRPLPFLAAWSRSSMMPLIWPVGLDHHVPRQVRDLTGPQPALVDSNTITRLRSGLRGNWHTPGDRLTSAEESSFCLSCLAW